MPDPNAHPRRILPTLVVAQLLGVSPWFAVNAVMPDLQRELGHPEAAVGLLTSAVQLGFIVGALVFALLSVADRLPARRVFLACALLGAGCTLGAAASAASLPALAGWRFAGGVCLAGIYPVGMKIAAQWFPRGLGPALGWLVGALVLGSAAPHALRGLAVGWPWQTVFVGVSLASAAAGLMLIALLPEPTAASPRVVGLQWHGLMRAWGERRLRASVLGYFGHMWELYTLWVLVPLLLATRLQGAALSWAAFAVIGAGALGCGLGGQLARRLGSARVATAQLAVSGACCLLAPLLLGAPGWLFALWLLVWGITVAGDSPQFSALTAANAPPPLVGSVLTLTNSVGFAISIASIQLFVALAQRFELAMLLPWLALGPLLGLWAMRPLLARGAA